MEHVAIDLGSRKSQICVRSSDGQILEEKRWDFMVIGLPLRLPGATGSPWNPIAIF